MPQQVEIPGQGVVEFPDGMDDAAITEASKRLSQPTPSAVPAPPAEPPPTAVQQVLRGAGEAISEMIPRSAQDVARLIPIKPPELSDIIREAPLQIAQKAAEFQRFPTAPLQEKAATITREAIPLLSLLGLRGGARVGEALTPRRTLTEELSPETSRRTFEAPPIQEQPSALVEQTNQGLQQLEQGVQNATQERQITEGGVPEYQGVPPRENVPANAPEIREGAGGPPSGRGGVEPAPSEQIAPTVPQPELTYKQAQSRIDEIETQLEKQGLDPTKLVPPNEPGAKILLDSGWKPMPPELQEAYRQRDQIGSVELKKSVGDISSALQNTGLSKSESDAVLKHYAIDPEKTDVFAQYMASEHAHKLAQEKPEVQAENLAYTLAAERGEKFDQLRDISPRTLRDAAKAVQAMRGYFGVTEKAQPRLLPGETQGDLISSTQQEPLQLVGQKGTPAPPTEPPVRPPTTAAPEPTAPQPDLVTGIANKVTAQERARRGLPEAETPERRSWQQAMDEAQARDAEGPTLVEELKNNPRALTDTEDALLLREQIKSQQAHDAAVKEVNANPGNAEAQARLEAARDRVQTIYDVDKQVGTAGGRGLNARKMLADQDFTLAKMEAEVRAAGGGEPLKGDRGEKLLKKTHELHKKIQRTEESYQKQIQKGIAEYQRRTGEKDVSPLRPPRRVITDPETIKLLHARDKARAEYHDMLAKERFNAAPLYRKFGHYAAELGVGLSRSIKSAFDLSGLLRQGGPIVSGHPVMGAKSIAPMVKAFASEEAQTAAMQDIISEPLYDRMRHAKLEITEPGGRMSSREEVFRSELAEKIPGVAASERAYTTVLNVLRSENFKSLVGLAEKTTGRKLTAGEDRLIANYVNIASGRGSMGRFAPAANAMSKVLWSPRLAVSRIQYLSGQPIWGNLKAGGAPAVRMLIAAEYARTLTGVAIMAGLAKAAGADIELDPRSGNFGIRFGNTRIDITAGAKSYINYFSRILTNKLKTQKGEIKPLGGNVVTPTAGELTWRLLRGKLAPAYGSAFNVLEGQAPTGEPTTPINEILGFYAPLSPQDVHDALQTEGVPQKAILSLLAIGGMSVQNYEAMNTAQKNAIKARLQQRDQALLRGDINSAYRLTFPPQQQQQSGKVVNY